MQKVQCNQPCFYNLQKFLKYGWQMGGSATVFNTKGINKFLFYMGYQANRFNMCRAVLGNTLLLPRLLHGNTFFSVLP